MLLHTGKMSHIFQTIASALNHFPTFPVIFGLMPSIVILLHLIENCYVTSYFARLLFSFYFPMEMCSHGQELHILHISRTCHGSRHVYSSYSELLAIHLLNNC